MTTVSKKISYGAALLALYLTPVFFALAQHPGGADGNSGTGARAVDGDKKLDNYADSIVRFFNEVLIPLILAIAFLVFIWGVFRFFIMGAQDETARENGKSLMIWGIIGFVVIISIVGIVALLGNATGLSGEQTLPRPQL